MQLAGPAAGRRAIAALAAAVGIAGCGSGESASPNPVPEEGLSRLELIGKRAFFDTTLSRPQGQSCGSCHDPATGFSGNFGSAQGVPFAADRTTLGLRNTPSAAYAAFSPAFEVVATAAGAQARGGQFLDGRAASLEEQASLPLFSPAEMNLPSGFELLARIANAEYATLVAQEFGQEVFSSPAAILDAITRAIAAFERTAAVSPFSSRLDQALDGGTPLAGLEAEGMALFTDPAKGDCARCHAFRPESRAHEDRLFTSHAYFALGAPRNRRIPANADPAHFDLGLCGPVRVSVDDPRLCGAFKVPTLRNVARKAAFMHNGVFSSLRDAVAFHVTRDTQPARWYPSGMPFDDLPASMAGNVAPLASRLDEREIDAVVAFLRTLDDGAFASAPGAAPALARPSN